MPSELLPTAGQVSFNPPCQERKYMNSALPTLASSKHPFGIRGAATLMNNQKKETKEKKQSTKTFKQIPHVYVFS